MFRKSYPSLTQSISKRANQRTGILPTMKPTTALYFVSIHSHLIPSPSSRRLNPFRALTPSHRCLPFLSMIDFLIYLSHMIAQRTTRSAHAR